MTFVLHLTDRIVFSVASGDRDLFMNRLVEILAEKIDRGEVGEMRQLPGEGFVRISFAAAPETIGAGVERIGRCLRAAGR